GRQRASVLHAGQAPERGRDDAAGRAALRVGDEADAAGVELGAHLSTSGVAWDGWTVSGLRPTGALPRRRSAIALGPRSCTGKNSGRRSPSAGQDVGRPSAAGTVSTGEREDRGRITRRGVTDEPRPAAVR